MESGNIDIYCSIWMEFAVRILHIMSVNICEFRNSRHNEERAFLLGLNEITYSRIPFLIVKNALVK